MGRLGAACCGRAMHDHPASGSSIRTVRYLRTERPPADAWPPTDLVHAPQPSRLRTLCRLYSAPCSTPGPEPAEQPGSLAMASPRASSARSEPVSYHWAIRAVILSPVATAICIKQQHEFPIQASRRQRRGGLRAGTLAQHARHHWPEPAPGARQLRCELRREPAGPPLPASLPSDMDAVQTSERDQAARAERRAQACTSPARRTRMRCSLDASSPSAMDGGASREAATAAARSPGAALGSTWRLACQSLAFLRTLPWGGHGTLCSGDDVLATHLGRNLG